ncbi:TrkH family potassium uptake protein [Dissulfurirhabdus thermomarina]|uniref:TrkH family potassium uptake protein n=1 Tax=Dissulfurirhabdus thermomarina TaxID=1765737 RepID=A0A6N9TKC0_DISTH|nr:TrkH family potassium uptake protein [Dissulfurirhabdus thermomarina]NDY41711.1 TrkH family potassium uptake protein [Dissulfurirhabdus thermomarina]NMX23197.1 TrkH family potassium uptake protein [Dissulfurirhabdus thermomarina]
MRSGTVAVLLGWLLVFLGAALLVPVAVSIYFKDGSYPFFILSSLITILLGVALAGLFRADREIGNREGFAVVALGWIAAAGLGALPFYLSGAVPSYLDAYFEAMSGFTTTGSTILREVEPLGPSLLFWRALTQWLGGMGIIVLSLAILPVLGIGGMQLFQAEMPGPTKDRLSPRIQDTARILWGVYVLLTLAETVLLRLGGMGLFDAVCHSFATMATGGFSTRTASVAAFHSAWVDGVVTVFMVLAGINFTLHHRWLTGHLRPVWRNEELRFYLGVGLAATAICTLVNVGSGTYADWGASFRYGAFQSWSILTTTGFGTADFDRWAPVCRLLLVTLMFLGGMAGSTGGGIKHVRVLLFWKFTRVQVRRLIHPRSVEVIKLDGRPVPDDVMKGVLGFLALYFAVFVAASLVVTWTGVDLVTGTTAVVATLNNIGPGLAGVGPLANFADLPALAKFVLVICMVGGRLELYTLAVLLVPGYWKGLRAPRFRWRRPPGPAEGGRRAAAP